MATEKTWQSFMNCVLPQTSASALEKAMVWGIKAALKGDSGLATYLPGGQSLPAQGLWTCYYSCDGTTAGAAGDGVDRFGGGATYDSSKVVNAAGGVAHSWVVLKSPNNWGGQTGLNVYLLINCNNANPYTVNLALAKTAFTGGSTTAAPTSTDSASATVTIHDNATIAMHQHFLLSSDGLFWFTNTADNTGKMGMFGLSLQALAEASASDTHNYHMYWLHDSATGTSWTRGSLQTTAQWYCKDANGDSTQAAICCFGGTGGSVLYAVDYATRRRSDGLVGGDRPIYMTTFTAGHQDDRGRLYDAREAKTSLIDGECDPNSTNPTSVKAGNLWLPYQTVPIL